VDFFAGGDHASFVSFLYSIPVGGWFKHQVML
jgi:hypothetical protein